MNWAGVIVPSSIFFVMFHIVQIRTMITNPVTTRTDVAKTEFPISSLSASSAIKGIARKVSINETEARSVSVQPGLVLLSSRNSWKDIPDLAFWVASDV